MRLHTGALMPNVVGCYHDQQAWGTGAPIKPRRPCVSPTIPAAPNFGQNTLMGAPVIRENPNTGRKLIEAWQQAQEWKAFAKKTRIDWERYCKRIGEPWGGLDVRGI
jgi:hypothetical protein